MAIKISQKNKEIIRQYNLLKESQNIKKINKVLIKSKKAKDKKRLIANQKRFNYINKKLYGNTAPYSKKRISKSLKKQRKLKQSAKKLDNEIKVYRYSVHHLFVGSGYEKEFRAVVYTNKKQGKDIIRELQNHILRRISLSNNRGLRYMFDNSFLEGHEADEVGINDLGSSQLNHVVVTFENTRI